MPKNDIQIYGTQTTRPLLSGKLPAELTEMCVRVHACKCACKTETAKNSFTVENNKEKSHVFPTTQHNNSLSCLWDFSFLKKHYECCTMSKMIFFSPLMFAISKVLRNEEKRIRANPLDGMQIFHSAHTNHMMRLQIPATKRWFNGTALPIEMETGKVFPSLDRVSISFINKSCSI